jgi:hypothetical protein
MNPLVAAELIKLDDAKANVVGAVIGKNVRVPTLTLDRFEDLPIARPGPARLDFSFKVIGPIVTATKTNEQTSVPVAFVSRTMLGA